VESRQPKKFSAMFFDDLLGRPGILNYLLTIIGLEACKLYNRHVNSLLLAGVMTPPPARPQHADDMKWPAWGPCAIANEKLFAQARAKAAAAVLVVRFRREPNF
jgi:hypothetical protein